MLLILTLIVFTLGFVFNFLGETIKTYNINKAIKNNKDKEIKRLESIIELNKIRLS
jgi:hypothetical protein